MADTYYGRLTNLQGASIVGALVKAFEEETNTLLCTTTTDTHGDYTLTNLIPADTSAEAIRVLIKFYGSDTGGFNYVTGLNFPLYNFAITLPVDQDLTSVLGNKIDFQVTETELDSDQSFHNPSFAQVDLTNIDVTSGNIKDLEFYYRATPSGYGIDFETNSSWTSLGSTTVNYNEDTINETIQAVYANIPVTQYINSYYEFKVKALNQKSNLSTFETPISYSSIPGTVSVTNGVATFTTSDQVTYPNAFENMTADGYYFNFYNGSSLICSRPVAKADNNSIKFNAVDNGESIAFTSINSLAGDTTHTYIYDIGANVIGQPFNGIADFEEIPMALQAEVFLGDNYYSNASPTVISNYTIPGTTVKLRWQNMYKLNSSYLPTDSLINWPHVDGEVRDLSSNLLSKIDTYKIFMFVSDKGLAPTNHTYSTLNTNFLPNSSFPAPAVLNSGEDEGVSGDGSDSNGQWYFIDEIAAPRVVWDGSTTNRYVYADVNVPGGENVAFWIGFSSKYTGIKTEEINSQGVPKGSTGARRGDRPQGGTTPFLQEEGP